MKEFLTKVIGKDDDIITFEYTKKINKEKVSSLKQIDFLLKIKYIGTCICLCGD
jgi:hypothetical protein